MKKTIALLLIFNILVSTFIFSEDIKLTPSQENYFINHRLSLDIESGTISTYNQYSGFMAADYKLWQGYLGFQKINEETFFRTAGQIEAAEQARKYRVANNTMMIVGGIAYAVGIGIMLGGLSDNAIENDTIMNNLLIGGGIGVAAAFPLGIGIDRSLKNWAPTSQAQYFLETYNEELIEYISENVE